MLRAGLVASVVLVAMCGEAGTDPVPPDTSASTPTVPSAPATQITLHTTHHRLDGNRYAAGRGAVPAATPVDVVLGGTPAWIVGVPVGGEAVWVVALEDGTLPPGTPPAAYAAGDEVVVVVPGPGDRGHTGAELAIVAELGGYTSHVIGTRNLDLALAADADGDGQVELVVPTQEPTELAESWRVALPGRITTNLAAAELPGGRLDLAAGTAEGVLRIWPGG